jgi:hypothetical protein
VSHINYTLKAKVKTTNGTTVDVSATHRKSFGSFDEGITTSFHLKKMTNNKYHVYVFGKNGEYKKNYNLTVWLDHVFLKDPVEVQLQTNENGIIDLGELDNIKSIIVADCNRQRKKWDIPDISHAALSYIVNVAENEPFKSMCNTKFHDSLYSLYALNDE